MNPLFIGSLGIAAMFFLILLQVPIGISMAAIGFIGVGLMDSFSAGFSVLGAEAASTLGDVNIAVIPLFMLMGNFAAAGLSDYIDARLGDAHEIVPSLEGPFDFVFSDADKGWYKNYLIAVLPKLEVGGCYTTHNVSMPGRGRRGRGGSGDYMEYLMSLPNLETTVDSRGGGLAISYKKSE